MWWDNEVAEDIELAPTFLETEAGEAMRAKAENVPDDSFCATGLNDRTAAQLRATLEQLTDSVDNVASAGS